MKDFIKRNSPVFVIGALTLFVFLIIIVLSQKNLSQRPQLVAVSEKELISPHTYTLGKENAPITLVEFSDFECPGCKAFQPAVKQVYQWYSDYLRVGFRHFPLPQHKDAKLAAIATQAAGNQGKFWEYADLLFENQSNLSRENLIAYAEQLGLDVQKFQNDLNNSGFDSIVNEDISLGLKLGVNSTPTLFLNGKMMQIKDANDFEDQLTTAVEQVDKNAKKTTQDQTKQSSSSSSNVLTYAEIDKTHGTLEISYTDQGFILKNTNALQGQLVRWTNKTNKDMVFEQLMPTYEELKKLITVRPGQTFEFRLYKDGLWTYEENVTKNFGSILVSKPEL